MFIRNSELWLIVTLAAGAVVALAAGTMILESSALEQTENRLQSEHVKFLADLDRRIERSRQIDALNAQTFLTALAEQSKRHRAERDQLQRQLVQAQLETHRAQVQRDRQDALRLFQEQAQPQPQLPPQE